MPVSDNRVFIVTGANSGLGYETALGLVRAGGTVVAACRNLERARTALAPLRAAGPPGMLELMQLNLADLASVRSFAKAFLDRFGRLDVLINNAGVMALPRLTTTDGFEMQIGTNHLGHFALTGLLLERLLAAPAGRVVTLSSGAHRLGRIRFDDLHSERRYGKWRAYAQSKLANLLFTFELQRRLQAAGARLASLASHPGYASTNLQLAGPRMVGSRGLESLMRAGNRLLSQSAAMGALPTLYAACAPEAAGGDYIGPAGLGELWGAPTKVESNARSLDPSTAAKLWDVSEVLTGVRYALLRP